LEEDWFFEAVTEVYLPLLEIFTRLSQQGVEFRLTFGLSPTLTAMFQDPLLASRYEHHLENLIALSESECRRLKGDSALAPLAGMYRDRFLWCRQLWRETFGRDLVGAFRNLAKTGRLELITTAATHGFLPLMEVTPAALKAQVAAGIQSFEQAFGMRPEGFWLPECGYTPLAEEILAQNGIRYTFLETHGILHATPRPQHGVYAPVASPHGLTLFGRDPETANQVWSSVEGYPGDFWYREFYRDIGHDLEEGYLKPFLYHGGMRVSTGIKYYRITGKTDRKEPYDPARAWGKAKEHAENFLFNRERQMEHLRGAMGEPPVVVAMYDAELFGHWWFEGPGWLEQVLRGAGARKDILRLSNPSEIAREGRPLERVTPHLSTWGWKGYNEVWLQGANAWIYRHLHRAAWRMEELVAEHPAPSELTRRALNQALRELFLAQSSDWAFILGTGTSTRYARERVRRALARFTKLYEQLKGNAINELQLREIEGQDNLFAFLDYRRYGEKD
jgi:1,4-alpha-glucan branching enzyme